MIGFGTIELASCQDKSSKNDTLLDAMSPYEDMAEAALAKSQKRVQESLSEAETGSADVLKALPPAAVKKYEQLLKSIQDGAKAKDYYPIAVNAVEMFRLLAESLVLRAPRTNLTLFLRRHPSALLATR